MTDRSVPARTSVEPKSTSGEPPMLGTADGGGRFAFVSVDNDPVPGGITTFSRDVDTGLLSGVETLVSAAGRPIGVTSHLAVSPDGETLYATGWNNGVDTDFGPGGRSTRAIGRPEHVRQPLLLSRGPHHPRLRGAPRETG